MTIETSRALRACAVAAALLALPAGAQAAVLSQAATSGLGATAAAVGAGPVQVSRSSATSTGARWDAVVVAEQSLYGWEDKGNGDAQAVGVLAPAAPAIAATNQDACRTIDGRTACVFVLPGGASHHEGGTATGALVAVGAGDHNGRGAAVYVARSLAMQDSCERFAEASAVTAFYTLDGAKVYEERFDHSEDETNC